MNPSSNLFKRAVRLIKPTTISYLKYQSRVLNAARQYVPDYDDPVTVEASVQAVNRARYTAMGLDFSKNYIKVFLAEDVIGLGRDTSSDRFVFNNKTYQVDSQNNWYIQDGWGSCLAIEIS